MGDLQTAVKACKTGFPKVRDQEVGGSNPLAPTKSFNNLQGLDDETQAALDRLSRHAFELGLYDRNEMPEGGNDE